MFPETFEQVGYLLGENFRRFFYLDKKIRGLREVAAIRPELAVSEKWSVATTVEGTFLKYTTL